LLAMPSKKSKNIDDMPEHELKTEGRALFTPQHVDDHRERILDVVEKLCELSDLKKKTNARPCPHVSVSQLRRVRERHADHTAVCRVWVVRRARRVCRIHFPKVCGHRSSATASASAMARDRVRARRLTRRRVRRWRRFTSDTFSCAWAAGRQTAWQATSA
jgi:hypothetical protein